MPHILPNVWYDLINDLFSMSQKQEPGYQRRLTVLSIKDHDTPMVFGTQTWRDMMPR